MKAQLRNFTSKRPNKVSSHTGKNKLYRLTTKHIDPGLHKTYQLGSYYYTMSALLLGWAGYTLKTYFDSIKNIENECKISPKIFNYRLNLGTNTFNDPSKTDAKDSMDFETAKQIADFQKEHNADSVFYYLEVEMDQDEEYKTQDVINRLGPKVFRLYKAASDPLTYY